jgi:hypothetical protein
MDIAFKSIMHDAYSKELSVKVKQAMAMRARKGEYISGDAPFGYIRSDKEKNRLIVDEAAALTVRRIFDLARTAKSAVEIASVLNADGIDSPQMHRKYTGRATFGATPRNGRTFWGNKQVLTILSDERYTGTMVSMKSVAVAPNNKKYYKGQPEGRWVKVPNTHEAIISAEQFAGTPKFTRQGRRANKGASLFRSPFAGKIFCGHCGRAMPHQGSKQPYHFCKGVRLKLGQGCYDGHVLVEGLKGAALAAVKAEAQMVFTLNPRNLTSKQKYAELDKASAKLKKAKALITLLEQRNLSLYEDFADGKADKDGYIAAKAKNSVELEMARNCTYELESQLRALEDKAAEPSMDESVLHRIMKADEISDEVLSLVDSITVFDSERIEIKLAFGDAKVVKSF